MKTATREATVAPVSEGLRILESLPRNSSCGFTAHRERGAKALLLTLWERKTVGRK